MNSPTSSREERTVSNNLTLQYDKVVFLLQPNEITRELRRKRVTVIDYPDGRLAIRYRGLDLPYITFDKLRQVSQASIVENKHLGAVLSHIASSRSNALRLAASPRHAARGRSITCSKSAEDGSEPVATFARRTAPARRHCLAVAILCAGQDAVKPGPAGPRLRRLRA